MPKLILSLFTVGFLSAGSTAWGAEKSLDQTTSVVTYDDSWAVRHPDALDLRSLSRLFQAYESADAPGKAANLNNLKNAVLTDIAADRLLDINRRFLIKKANRAHGITKDGPIGDKVAELARIQRFLAELS